MIASKQDIRDWLLSGKTKGATHVIVMTDTFEHDDYHVDVMPGTDINKEVEVRKKGEMQVMREVYNLSMDIESQINQPRAWNL
jgi:hypothetical protein